jgi:O-antigen/teichoic acid export membrane protein
MFNQLLRLSKHSMIYGLGATVSQIIGFFLLPVYTRYLTPSDYGILEIFTTTQGILSIIFVMGLGTSLFMVYYNCEEVNRKNIISTALIFLTFFTLLFTFFLIKISGECSQVFFHSTQYAFYFQVVFLTLFFDTAIGTALSVFRAKEEPKKYALISIIRILLVIVLNMYYVVILKKGVLGILESSLVTAGLLYFLLIPSIIKNSGLKFSVIYLKEMISFGLPLVPASLGSLILTASDRYFLYYLSTSQELGLYSLGYKFGMVIQGLIVGPFSLAWGPFFWSIAKQNNCKEIYSSVLTYFVLLTMSAVLCLSIFSKDLLRIMTTPLFHEAYKVIPIIALSYLLYGCYFILSTGFNLAKKTKYSPIIVGITATINLGLNYLLIPSYGMFGAAVATLVSYIILCINSFILSRNYYHIKYEWYRVAKIFFCAILVYEISSYIDLDSMIFSILLKTFTLLLYPILLYFLNFFKQEELLKGKNLIWTVHLT